MYLWQVLSIEMTYNVKQRLNLNRMKLCLAQKIEIGFPFAILLLFYH